MLPRHSYRFQRFQIPIPPVESHLSTPSYGKKLNEINITPRYGGVTQTYLHGTSTRTENRSNFLRDAFLLRAIPFRGIPP